MANQRTINVYNVTLTVANTEYSQALPPNVRSFAVQPRTAVDVRMAFVTGKVAGSTASGRRSLPGRAVRCKAAC